MSLRRLLLPAALCLLVFLTETAASGAPEINLDVRWYGQTGDGSWERDNLGTSETLTIRTHGCALTAASMVLKYLDIRTNPGRLNRWLLKNGGYADGWDDSSSAYLGKVRIIWTVPADKLDRISEYRRRDFHNEPADTELIREYLEKGIPVIAEVRLPDGTPHFVVIHGFRKEDFLIRDPLDRKIRRLSDKYNLSDRWGSGAARNIYGLRIYLPG